MSEYQYYEFQAIDRPLSKQEMAEVRALSTRATITSTRFVNVYNWGDFKGDPLTLVERYYDAFLYVANWGTHQLMLRLPKSMLDQETASRYCMDEDVFGVHTTRDHVILSFNSETEDFEDSEEGESWLSSLAFLRADICAGDVRSLYLGWLLCVQNELLHDDLLEPPVPPGLGDLSGSLQALVDFLEIEDDLLQAAAERSESPLKTVPSAEDARQWLSTLTGFEKDDLLVALASGSLEMSQAELRRRIRESGGATETGGGRNESRTVRELLAAAKSKQQEREQQESQERLRRQKEEAIARNAYLDSIAGRVTEVWHQVETLIDAKRQAEYADAIRLLVDLRDLAAREHEVEDFEVRLRDLRARNARKISFLSKLDQAGLRLFKP